MSRKLLFAALASVFVVMLSLGSAGAADLPLQGRIVALDAGHGEYDGEFGTSNTVADGTVIWEYKVNWAVMEATEARLQALGATVVRTRPAIDAWSDRPTRYAVANDAGAQVLISIHHNGSTDHTLNYTSVYYTQKSDLPIASAAYDELLQHLGFDKGGTHRDGFGMTVRPKMPSALTEAWFLTNDALAEKYYGDPSSLIDPEAQALTDAVVTFFAGQSSGGGKGKPTTPR